MTVPGTFKKPAVVREIEALRVKPGEVLVLRFAKEIEDAEMNLFARALEQSDLLRGRVVCMKFDGEMAVVEAPTTLARDPEIKIDDGFGI